MTTPSQIEYNPSNNKHLPPPSSPTPPGSCIKNKESSFFGPQWDAAGTALHGGVYHARDPKKVDRLKAEASYRKAVEPQGPF